MNWTRQTKGKKTSERSVSCCTSTSFNLIDGKIRGEEAFRVLRDFR